MEQTTMFEALDKAIHQAKTRHLPGAMEEAIPFYRSLIERYNAAVLECRVEDAAQAYREAHDLAIKLNGGTNLGVIAYDDSPGCVLERETAAPAGQVPLWGQAGEFIIQIHPLHGPRVRVKIEQDGLFGLGCWEDTLPSFSAHAVDWDKPFISETGYRSFLGIGGNRNADGRPGRPDCFAYDAIVDHIADKKHGLNGKLVMIDSSHRPAVSKAA